MPDQEINIVDPKPLPPEPNGRPYARYFFSLFILIGVLVLGYKIITAPTPQSLGGRVLAPSRTPWLSAVKQFFFHSNPGMTGFEDDRINILVLGIGGSGHDGPYLSDTNIIVSIKPSTNEVALISVPRDLAAPVGKYGWRKINSADAFGEMESPGNGGDFARQIFSDVFKTSIPYYVRIDFSAFQEIIDAVGGITVNVPKSFTDTTFPTANYGVQTISFTAGEQNMNGETALNFSRSRHGDNGEGSDFARSRRQELVMLALKDKILSLGTLSNPAKLQAMYTALTSHINSNLTFEQLVYLAGFAKEIQHPRTIVFDSSPGGFLVNATGEDGAFILSPVTGSFDAMSNAINGVFNTSSTPVVNTVAVTTPTPVTTLPTNISSRVEIQNGTWRVGLASRWQEKMAVSGYNVLRIGNSLKRPVDRTVIYVLNQKTPHTSIDAASKLLNAPFSTVLPDWLQESYDNPSTPESEQGVKYNNAADLLVILGTDAKD